MITYRKGNIIELVYNYNKDSYIYLPHVCNNIGLMGAGIALGIANEWPEVKKAYVDMYDMGEMDLGSTQYVDIEGQNITIINMIAQNNLKSKNNKIPLDYVALENCMRSVKVWIDKDNKSNKEIHTVKFGSMRAGGDWNRIEGMINDIWVGIYVFVYELE